MSASHLPATLAGLEEAISRRASFHGMGYHGENLWVLSSASNLTGPLAADVIKSQSAYTARYMAGGGRDRLSGEVVYYVADGDYVLGYVTADGNTATSEAIATPARRQAIELGLQRAANRANLMEG